MQVLIAATEDEDPRVREFAVAALGESGDESAVEPLLTALEEGHSLSRWAAVCALSQIGNERAEQALIAALKNGNESWQFRSFVATQLGKTRSCRAVPALILAMEDKQSGVRKAAISALGEIGDKRAVTSLIARLTNGDLSHIAADSLQRIGWQPGTKEERIHFQVVFSDPAIKEPKNWPDVKTVLMYDAQSEDAQVVEYVVHTFIWIGNESVVPELVELIRTKGTKATALILKQANTGR